MVSRMGLVRLLAVLVVGMILPQAFAMGGDDFEKMAKEKMKEFDKNRDGKITEEDVDNKDIFKKFDRDHDGEITFEEILKTMKDYHDKEKEDRKSVV